MLRRASATVFFLAGMALALVAVAGCGSSTSTAANGASTRAGALPGTGRPAITVGDKNFTEQFVLGELYSQALQAQGFSVQLNQNIGPTEVTLQALKTNQLGLYPEYLNVWDASVAGYSRTFTTRRGAYRAGQRYARAHGMKLLDPTPFSDTDAIGVTVSFAQHNHLKTIGDLAPVATTLTLGVPPQFETDPKGLLALEQTYGFTPATVKALEIGAQYQALDQGTVQAADVSTTDGELTTGNYTLLGDPRHVFGVGNVVPVVSEHALEVEGPAFARTVNRVSALLTLPVIQELNAAVDVASQQPATVAKRFLIDHGLVPTSTG